MQDVVRRHEGDQGRGRPDRRLRFADLPGMWQHTSYPSHAIRQDGIDEGLGFDGSSIRGFQVINDSDMLLMPDPTTAFIDPFMRPQDPGPDLRRPGPDDQGVLSARPARRRPEGRGPSQVDRHRRHRLLRPRGRVLRLRRRRATAQSINYVTYESRLGRGPLEQPTATRARTSATRSGPRRATSRCRRGHASTDIRAEMVLDHDQDRHRRSSASTTRSRPPASARST